MIPASYGGKCREILGDLPIISVPWDSIIITILHLLIQHIRYRVFTRKAKSKKTEYKEWHQ